MTNRRWAFALAIAATGTAITLSVLSGWQRGGSIPERLVWVAIGIVLVASAHLLPYGSAAWQRPSMGMRRSFSSRKPTLGNAARRRCRRRPCRLRSVSRRS